MESVILVADTFSGTELWFGAIATVAGGILGALAQPVASAWLETRKTPNLDLPDIVKKWNATWYVDHADGQYTEEQEYTTEPIRINKQRGAFFEGVAHSKIDQGVTYQIRGRFNSHGIVTFSYDAGTFGNALVGGGILKANATYTEYEGRWHGFVREGVLASGHVVWKIAQ